MAGRWIRFIIAIAVGVGAGLLYGWVINPAKFVDTSPDTLRLDYKTDYVLMVAESYHADKDLGLAAQRLSLLGKSNPAEMVVQAIFFAERVGYAENDLNLMRYLSVGLQGYQAGQGTKKP